MSNFLIIIFCLLVGYLLRQTSIVKPDGYRSINAWIIYVGLPATSFVYLPDLVWSRDLILALLGPVVIFGGSWLFVKLLEKPFRLSKRTVATLILVSGLSNTSFVGFPLVSYYFGEEMLKWAIISDQTTFFLLSSLGVIIAIKGTGSEGKINLIKTLKRVFTFPPLLACLTVLLISPWYNFSDFKPFFKTLAGTVTPLALFSIGMQLSFSFYKSELKIMSLSILYKLFLGPLAFILFCYFFSYKGEVAQIAAFEMAMPSLVATGIVLNEFGLNTKLGNGIIGVSIILGLITTYLAYNLINYLL